MNHARFFRLFTLAAIWGGSFLFTRISTPVSGSVIVAEYRGVFAPAFPMIVGVLLHGVRGDA